MTSGLPPPPLIRAFLFEKWPFVALAGGQEIGAQAWFDAGAAEFEVELATGGEDGVADDFGLHAEELRAKSQGRRAGRLPIRG